MKKLFLATVFVVLTACSGTTLVIPRVVLRPDGTVELDFSVSVTSTTTSTSTPSRSTK